MNRWGVFLRPNDRWYFLLLLLILLPFACLLWVNMPHWNVQAKARHVASVGNQESPLHSSLSVSHPLGVFVASGFAFISLFVCCGCCGCFLPVDVLNFSRCLNLLPLFAYSQCPVRAANMLGELGMSTLSLPSSVSLSHSRSLWCLLIYAGQSKFRL